MTKFRLRVEGAGAARTIELETPDAASAVRRAAQMGLRVLALESISGAAVLPAGGSNFSLLLFNQELQSLLEAGLHLSEALATLLAKERAPAVAELLRALADELSKGRNFSDVLADHPARFPAVYVAIVSSAERTGDLAHALARFITYQLQFELVRKKVVSALIYPTMLLVVGGGVTLFLLAYVVPRFAGVYASSGREMPALSGALLAVGRLVQTHGVGLAMAALLIVAALTVALRRAGWDGVVGAVLRLPGVASRAEQFRLARTFRATGLLLASGVALPRALGMVEGLLAPSQRERLRQARALIERGLPLTQALVAQGLATPVALSLLAVGERSGQLAAMLERAARFQDDELERWLDWTSRLIEPILMVLIGVVVGGVVLLLYLPIFELAGGL